MKTLSAIFFNLTLIFLKRLKQRFSGCLRLVQLAYGKNEWLGLGLERDGSETCEERVDTVYALDTSIGRLKMITSTLALTTFLENLWKFLTAFQITSDGVSCLEEAINLTQSYYSFLEKASLKVQQIKGSTAKTQGPDGTLSMATLNSVEMILSGLNRLKEDVIHLNPEYLEGHQSSKFIDPFCGELLFKYEGWKYGHAHSARFLPAFSKMRK